MECTTLFYGLFFWVFSFIIILLQLLYTFFHSKPFLLYTFFHSKPFLLYTFCYTPISCNQFYTYYENHKQELFAKNKEYNVPLEKKKEYERLEKIRCNTTRYVFLCLFRSHLLQMGIKFPHVFVSESTIHTSDI